MQLRGFDQYEVKLGDEMRGERASLGKNLADVERELRIKSELIVAIEDCDAEPFPNPGLIPGYVRSYARYLGMDADDCYHRFCVESGFRSPMALAGIGDAARIAGDKPQISSQGIGADNLAQSRFAAPAAPTRIGGPVSLGGLASVVALAGVVSGLGYGGYALLQEIQKIGIEPLPEAPAIVAEAPLIQAPAVDPALIMDVAQAETADTPLAGDSGSAIAAVPTMIVRDGPISAIDPATSGVLLHDDRRDVDPMTSTALATAAPDFPAEVRTAIREEQARRASSKWEMPEFGPVETAAKAAGSGRIVVHAADTAWVRIRDEDSGVLFEGVMAPGDSFEVPERVRAASMRAGNAGGVFLIVDGAIYGPVGQPGKVVKDVSLSADDLLATVPVASRTALARLPESAGLTSASASAQ